MTISNAEIAATLDQLADLLEIQGENPFRIRAYHVAAKTIRELDHELAELVASHYDLTQLPGIGEGIATKIKTLVKTGKLPQLAQVSRKVPIGLLPLLTIDGLGPKRVHALHQALHINSLQALKRAVEKGEVAKLPGFGAKTEALILQGIQKHVLREQRFLLVDAEQYVAALIAYLQKTAGVKRLEIAGSYRRRRETVGDIDLLAIATKNAKITDEFVRFSEVARVVSHGITRATVILRSGLQVDLRVVSASQFGSALVYFTGSKAHNIAIRRIANKKKLKINEYGVYRGAKRIAGKTEKEVYATINLPYIEPELRENRGEIAAGLVGKLPKLIRQADIRGDLHVHTKRTDGNSSLEVMAMAAKKLGYEYIAITDHTKHLTVAHGLTAKQLRKQLAEIDEFNAAHKGIYILKSSEVDILENGKLDLPNEVLRELDLTVCSIHSKFNLSKQKQTERVLRAMDNPYFTILGHPSGRLINRREAYAIDYERILQAAKDNRCMLEINAQPARMDLDDIHCKQAKDMGITLAISTDAHSPTHFANMRFGVYLARRGWLEKHDVLNTLPLARLRSRLRRI